MEQQELSYDDWELREEYYQEEAGKPELKLEDFMDDEAEDSVLGEFGTRSAADHQRFQKILQDVRQVLDLAGDGKTVAEIAGILGLNPQYVYDIQVSAQGFREDDEVAVAHLVEMSL